MEPFSNISNNQKVKILALLKAHTYTYHKNQNILSALNYENVIGIILRGNVTIKNIDYNGNETIIEKLKANDIFGNNISNINSSNSQIIANEETEIAIINYNYMLNNKHYNHIYYNIFISNLFEIVNNKCKDANEKLQIISKKTIRDKLLEYFEIQYKKYNSSTFILPFNLKDLADYLSVNRTAMFRELKALKDEGIISTKKNKITLLNRNNFMIY